MNLLPLKRIENTQLQVGMLVVVKILIENKDGGSELALVTFKKRKKCTLKILTHEFDRYRWQQIVTDDMKFYTSQKDLKEIDITETYDGHVYTLTKNDFNEFLKAFIAHDRKMSAKLNEEAMAILAHASQLLPANFTKKALLKRVSRGEDSNDTSQRYISETHYKNLRIHILGIESEMRKEEFDQVTKKFSSLLDLFEHMPIQEKPYEKLRTYIVGMQSDLLKERINTAMLKFPSLLQMLENMRKH